MQPPPPPPESIVLLARLLLGVRLIYSWAPLPRTLTVSPGGCLEIWWRLLEAAGGCWRLFIVPSSPRRARPLKGLSPPSGRCFDSFRQGGVQGLALIFIPAGGGGTLPPGPPPPLPPQLKCTQKPGFWEHFLVMGKKFSAPSPHAINRVHIAPCVLHIPCFPDYHAPTLVVSVFQLPGPTVATRKTRRRN